MSMQLQSVLSLSLEKTELLTAIKNESLEFDIGIDDIPNSLDEEIIPDVKKIDIVSHELSEELIKSTFENNHSGSLETQVFVKTENTPLIKTENISQSEYLYKTEDISDGNISWGTSQGVMEVQCSNEHLNALQSDKRFVNFFKDSSDISRKAKCPNKTDFSEYYKTGKSYCCEKCTFISQNHSCFKRHKLSHKTKPEVDSRPLKYRCDKCKYKTCWSSSFGKHKLMHLKPEEIPYFYCYHCPCKCKFKGNLRIHIFNHFKKQEVPFHCYICDFTTLKRDLIMEHFKKHHKHHSKCDETDYKNQFETYTKYRCDKCKFKTCYSSHFKKHKLVHLKPEEIPYFYCYHCPHKCKIKNNLKIHIFTHFKKQEVPFHCYICDFTTLKRNLIIEHFKKHSKHHSKWDKTDYETYTKKQMRHRCKKCSFTTYLNERLKLHELTHKKEAIKEYRCDKCKYKTFRHYHIKRHKLIHLKPEEIQYFYCYHCPYKSKQRDDLKKHILRHFKNEDIPIHCYICDFTTLKRNLIIEHSKKHCCDPSGKNAG